MFGWFKSKVTNTTEQFSKLAFDLLSLQLWPSFAHPKQAFGALMTNKAAAGYVFGFHDSLLQRLGLFNSKDKVAASDLMLSSYRNIFGQQAGYALYSMSLSSQDDQSFSAGRMNGGGEIAAYIDDKVPPLGLGRMLIFDSEA